MPLEAVMVCMDNSDYMRNCDYPLSRLETQTDAVQLVCGAKYQQNPESSVGILTTAGGRIDVLATPTNDIGQMFGVLPEVRVGGEADFVRGLQVAQLALKHRQNKNQKQRIVAFVGSPIDATARELEVLGRNLKKNNVALDIVSFGEVDENSAKLVALLDAVNSNGTSHIIEVPSGPALLSDVLISSAIICLDDGSGAGYAARYGDDGFDFGDDPDLVLALRISMEEERARQEALAKRAEAENAAGAAAAGGTQAPTAAPAPEAGVAAVAPSAAAELAWTEALAMEDMDEELRAALLESLKDIPSAQPAAAQPEALGGGNVEDAPPVDAVATADAAPDAATAAPVADPEDRPSAAMPAKVEEPLPIDTRWFQDVTFIQELMGSLPGVDIGDATVQTAIREAQERATKNDRGRSGAGASK